MTAPALTRLGELRTTQARHHRDESPVDNFDHPITTWTTTHIDGLRIRLDVDGADTALSPMFIYRIAGNDGWAVDPMPPHVKPATPHWAHLVGIDGRPAVDLPLSNGSITLDRAHFYELRYEGSAWALYQA